MTSKQETPATALLIVDVMNHFDYPGGSELAVHARKVAGKIRKLRDHCDSNGTPVIYVNDNWTQWRGEFSDLIESCVDQGGHAAAIAEMLLPKRNHYYVLKPNQSAFMASALPVLLQRLRIERVTLCGFATDACILSTAVDAKMRELEVWVPSDCTAAITQQRKRHALTLLRQNRTAYTQSAKVTNSCFPGP